jgi:hypothetical protein
MSLALVAAARRFGALLEEKTSWKRMKLRKARQTRLLEK